MKSSTHLAVDLGASSGRVTLVSVSRERVALGPTSRFPNGPVKTRGWRWNLTDLIDRTLDGVTKLGRSRPPQSIGVDAWGVDYGWVDPSGRVLDDPYCYRDPRTGDVLPTIPAGRAYQLTGVPNQAINTSVQLLADHGAGRGGAPHRMLFMPDLINFALAGSLRTESSIASTSQLIGVESGNWSIEMMKIVDVPASCLPEILPSGRIGPVRPDVASRIGFGLMVESIASHDTASALVATPLLEDRSAYLSLGTWALIGVERTSPLVSHEAETWGFANERGLDGRFAFHRSAMGLWLLQQCLDSWGGGNVRELLEAASELPPAPVIDPNDASLFEPGDMPSRLADLCGRTDQRPPASRAEFVRCVVDSLASAVAEDLDHLQQVTGEPVHRLHLVGGGSRSPFICQAIADACGRPVIAGPAEATTLGNALAQARAYGGPATIEEIRQLVARSGGIREYRPGQVIHVSPHPRSVSS